MASPYVPQQFTNIILYKIGSTQIGGVTKVSNNKSIMRAEGTSNDVLSGPTSSSVVGWKYDYQLETEDGNAMALIGNTPLTHSFVYQAAQNNAATTSMTDQLVTVANLVLDKSDFEPGVKRVGKQVYSFHQLATTTDVDQVTITTTTL